MHVSSQCALETIEKVLYRASRNRLLIEIFDRKARIRLYNASRIINLLLSIYTSFQLFILCRRRDSFSNVTFISLSVFPVQMLRMCKKIFLSYNAYDLHSIISCGEKSRSRLKGNKRPRSQIFFARVRSRRVLIIYVNTFGNIPLSISWRVRH